ncbi:MAG: FAD-dependent oxidoreductase [Cyanobacteria bacterium J06632_22]
MTDKLYDLICFGDEVPGVLAAVAAGREFSRQNNGKKLRVLLMSPGDVSKRIGGHLTRGELSYLDRCQVPLDVRKREGLATFGDPPAIYTEFLKRSSPAGENLDKKIALDPNHAAAALRAMLEESTDFATLRHIQIRSVLTDGNRIVGIQTFKDEVFRAKQFIDCTVNAELAKCAGVAKREGFGTLGIPETELPVTLVFETEGLTTQQLKKKEADFLKRFRDENDKEAQEWIKLVAKGDNDRIAILKAKLKFEKDSAGGDKKSLFFPTNGDYIDFRSPALSIAYHAFRGTEFDPNRMAGNGARLDQANVAILDGKGASGHKLSWNSLLFRVNATQANELAKTGAKPTPAMLAEFEKVKAFFIKTLGATSVRHASELYIRHAGNVAAEAVKVPLSGSGMLNNGSDRNKGHKTAKAWEKGISAKEALGTFGYHFDIRGGIEGFGAAMEILKLKALTFAKPLFNYGITHTQLERFRNTAVVSPASGFTGMAASAGRIVEFNVGVGQGVGIAIATALTQNKELYDIDNKDVHDILKATGKLPKIYGYPVQDIDNSMGKLDLALATQDSAVNPSPFTETPYKAANNTTARVSNDETNPDKGAANIDKEARPSVMEKHTIG